MHSRGVLAIRRCSPSPKSRRIACLGCSHARSAEVETCTVLLQTRALPALSSHHCTMPSVLRSPDVTSSAVHVFNHVQSTIRRVRTLYVASSHHDALTHKTRQCFPPGIYLYYLCLRRFRMTPACKFARDTRWRGDEKGMRLSVSMQIAPRRGKGGDDETPCTDVSFAKHHALNVHLSHLIRLWTRETFWQWYGCF